jgi:hypothetical protein
MINLRALAGLAFAAALGVAATPLTVLADPADDGRITAHWESVHAPSIPRAVRINETWYAAGEAYFRVDDQADAAAYSLSLATAVDRTVPLQAIDADTSAVPYLGQITSLVRSSEVEAGRGTLTDARAAAYQIAIWHLTDNLSIDPAHVPDPAIRSAASELIRSSRAESGCTDPQCATNLSTAATSATLSVRVGKTVDDAVLRIAIVTPISMFFSQRQYVDLRINGLGATVCPGETDRIRVDEPVTHNVLKSSCEFRSHDPTKKGEPATAGLPRLMVDRISVDPANSTANNIITVLIPRQDSSQQVQVLWTFSNGPGMIFMPSGPSSPIITASTFGDARTAAATIDPDDFSSFQEIVQQSILPIFTGHGGWGLVLLALLLVMLLVLKDWVIGLTNWMGRIIRGPWNRLWSWYKKKRVQRKARRAQRKARRAQRKA